MLKFIRSLLYGVLSLLLLLTALSVSAKNFDPPAGGWTPGNYPPTSMTKFDYLGISGVDGQQGLTRKYIVHVPKNYDANVAMPLMFCFHGIVQYSQMFCVIGSTGTGSTTSSNYEERGLVGLSEQKGFILVMVQGLSNSWNGGNCCGVAQIYGLNDVALVRAILAEVEKHLNVDRTRIYAVGFSNGAFLANRLACEASDIFAAIVSGAGGIRLWPMNKCKPANNVAVLELHGTWDSFVPYVGGKQSADYWAKVNGCSAQASASSFPPSGGDTQCVSYEGCPADGQVTMCTIQHGGHCWFGSASCGTGFGGIGAAVALLGGKNSDTMVDTDAVWPFLSQFHR